MTIKQWPAGVPYIPLRDGFDMVERYKPNLQHETEQGSPRQRPAASAEWAKLSYKIEIDENQARVIDNFLLVDLRQASARFYMPVGRFYDPDPWPNKLCMIDKGVYKIEPFAAVLALSFTLMVLDW